MGNLRPVKKALLMVGLLFSDEDYHIRARQLLEEEIGEIVMESPTMEWDFSDYYRKEMGVPIHRRFLFFKDLIAPDKLSAIKLLTNDMEKKLSTSGKRNINLDPGYITLAKLVLASTKDYSHRIYLKDGIYAEVTLAYSKDKGQFMPFVNTYRDYSEPKYKKFFALARVLLQILSRD